MNSHTYSMCSHAYLVECGEAVQFGSCAVICPCSHLPLKPVILQSKHRTLDPEEADYFYCAVYVNVFVWPVFGWADAPWYHAPFGRARNPCRALSTRQMPG
jgi:hypothetical protein